jgi:hypothetical protein
VPVLFLVFDTVISLMPIGPVKDSFVQRGYPVGSAVTIGLLALGCIALCFVPRRSFLSRRERAAAMAALPWESQPRISKCGT